MAEINAGVMAMVERALADAPDTSTLELFDRAKSLDASMKELSVRQFHARYPLQVKRRKSLAEGGGRRRKQARRSHTGHRGRRPKNSTTRLNAVLLEFAHAVSAANDRGPTAMIEFVANLDEWAAKVEKARG